MSIELNKTLYGRLYTHPKDPSIVVKSSNVTLKPPGVFDDPKRELAVLKELSHKNIIALLGFEETSTRLRLFLDRAQSDLFTYLQHWKHNLSEVTIRHIMLQVIQALEYLHVEKKMSHMDLSLENILIMDDLKSKEPWVTVSDFGATIPHEKDARFQIDHMPGKARYAAPELWKYRAPDTHALDIFALGVCMFAMTYSCMPFHFSHDAGYTNLSRLGCRAYMKRPNRQISDDLLAVIDACLRSDPLKRPSITELANMSFFKTQNVIV